MKKGGDKMYNINGVISGIGGYGGSPFKEGEDTRWENNDNEFNGVQEV